MARMRADEEYKAKEREQQKETKAKIHDRNRAFPRFPVSDGGARQNRVRNSRLRSKLRVLQRCKLF